MFQITVIIPTFNRKQYLFHAINSVLAQTYKNIELIIIDDGSSDKTINQLKSYESQLKIYRQKSLKKKTILHDEISISCSL